MKKSISILLVLCLIFLSSVAIAADQPFVEGVYYGESFKGEYGAMPSMLNFGKADRLNPGESLYDVKTTKVKSIRSAALFKSLSDTTYYVYAKWQFAQRVVDYEIDAMLVMTTPSGEYYATYNTWLIEETERRTVCSWFFDVTDCFQRYADEHNDTFEKGDYAFSLFFNNLAFRVVKVTVN